MITKTLKRFLFVYVVSIGVAGAGSVVQPTIPTTTTPGSQVQSSGSVTTTPSEVFSVNSSRNYLMVVNTGTQVIVAKIGSAPGAGEGIPIYPGGNWAPRVAPTESVYLKSSSGTQTYEKIEGTLQ